MPPRKPGLWEVMIGLPGSASTTKMRYCVGPGRDWKTDNCTKHDVTKTDKGYLIESICQVGPYTMTSRNIVGGDFETALTIEGEVKTRGAAGLDPNHASPGRNVQRYLGPCESGQSPGDIISQDGRITPWSARNQLGR